MSRTRKFLRAVVIFAVMTASGCSSVDLKTAVEITEVSSGYYDNGINAAGLNHLVPSLTFSIRNASERELTSIDMVVMYWAEGDDTEQDEAVIKVIGGTGLAPGASSDPVVSRSKVGYTLEQPRAELFSHRMFRDWKAKLFIKRGGKIVPAGEYKIERRLLLSAPTVPAPK